MADKQNILNEFDTIQEKLSQGFEEDPRLSSGVPAAQRGSDLDFIQMSGMVRPTPTPAPQTPAIDADLDASRPLSFFEKGVADVDAEMSPGIADESETAHQAIAPIESTRAAMSHLRDIIADLTKESPTATTDPALMAKLESEGTIPPAPETPAAPVLEELLSEFAPAHPMHQDAPVDETPAPVTIHEASVVAPEPEVLAAEPELIAEPEVRRVAPVLPEHAAQLEKAERLLEELEAAQAPPTQFEEHAPIAAAAAAMAEGKSAFDDEALPDEALDFKKHSKRRHRSPRKFVALKSLGRLAAGLLIVGAIAAATYTGYLWIQLRMSAPQQLYNQAAKLVAQGEYEKASEAYEKFASLHPQSPLRPEAQFAAAFVMQLQRPENSDDRQRVAGQSLRLFEQFRQDNPTHPKLSRAETLMGRLNFESERYQEAIELLRNPELRLRDPASAVPALRILARSSAKLGDAEAARSYYLQSAGVQDNYSPDVDYAELGALYQSLADRSEDIDKRIRLQQLAIESWSHALEVPGIDPSSKQSIRSQLDVLRERLQSEPGMSPAMEALDVKEVPGAEIPAVAPLEPIAEMPVSQPESTPAAAPVNPETPAAQPEATAVETPAAEPVAGDYVVKAGDTLTSIATELGTTAEALIETNALSGDKVFEGQHLIVPEPSQS